MSSTNTKPPALTPQLLRAYSAAALENAKELVAESSLLLAHGHRARAYFLAVASIEEVGKGLQAFDAQGRNLANPAVASRLKNRTEDHAHKITYAFSTWILRSKSPREALEASLGLITELKRGREPSMYSDLSEHLARPQLPRDVVSDSAAHGCVRLARDTLAVAVEHVSSKEPLHISIADEQLYTMKTKLFRGILENQDFWWYFIARKEAGHESFVQAVLAYEKEHVRTGKLFRHVTASE
jgi:AbiV family abortive infection protein